MARAFAQVDVFADEPFRGNPLAVVLDADGLDDATMQRFAHWTNLAETTFVQAPTVPGADYRVRIFTPDREVPFAGHPTLGSCHAWLEHTGADVGDRVVQECGTGLITVRRDGDALAFAEPPLLRSGPVDDALVGRLARMLSVDRSAITDTQWVDNGPGWVAVLLDQPADVLALTPRFDELDVGVVAPYPAGSAEAFEVRAFTYKNGGVEEDPVTGSLNASLAQWLLATGRATAPYVARQGTALGRAGRVHVTQDAGGGVWVGGGTVSCIRGEVDL